MSQAVGVPARAGRGRGHAALQARRKLWLKLHLWLGLALGLFLSVFGLTGAVLVFQSEIDHALNPALFHAPAPPGAQRRPLEDIVQAALRAAPPGWESGSLTAPDTPDGHFVAFYWMAQPTAAPEEAVALNVAIDAYRAEPVGRRVFYHAWNPLRHCLMGFFFKLHYALLLGDTGTTLVGVMALLLLISALSGLILWWPLDGKWRRVLTFKRGAGPARFNHDLHQLAGFYSLAVLLAVLLSGVYFNLPGPFRTAVGFFSPLTPEPGAENRASAAAGPAGTTGVDAMLARAGARISGGTLAYLSLPDPKTGLMTACYRDVPDLKRHVVDSRCLSFDGSGAVRAVSDAASGSGGDTFMLWQWPLHSGQAFGWTGRILVLLCGLACPVFFVTGVIRWLHKRRAGQIVDARRRALAA